MTRRLPSLGLGLLYFALSAAPLYAGKRNAVTGMTPLGETFKWPSQIFVAIPREGGIGVTGTAVPIPAPPA